MRNMFWIMFGLVINFLIGCAPQNNISVTMVNGNCADGQTNAPYCMAVTIHNNAAGQNWISSTNYPFNNITVSVSGVDNILSPSSTSSLDPNGCANSISPGNSCTFYLKINKEEYAVGSTTNANITINYTINDGLSSVFGIGNGSTQYSYSFVVKEYTNLYLAQQSGSNNLMVYNSDGIGYYTVESASGIVLQSIAADNSSYGYLWMATNHGMYWFGDGNTSESTSYAPSGTTGINNIFTSQPSPFESSSTSPNNMYGVAGNNLYSFSFDKLIWGNAITATSSSLLNNVNAVSTSGGNVVLASINQAFSCPTSSGSSTCISEASVLSDSIRDIGFTTISTTGYTGLYAATSGGLYAESGSMFPSSINGWKKVTESGIDNAVINALAIDDAGNIYAGDNTGRIWVIYAATAPINAHLMVTISSSSAVQTMLFDNIGSALYIVAGNNLYQCALSSTIGCINLGSIGNNSSMVGLAIGSSLTT